MSAFAENWREDLLAALAFLTRLPWPQPARSPEGPGVTRVVTLGEAAWAFPLVGAVIGIIGGIVYLIASILGLPALAAALLAVAATALATGALHEDGLADSADGLGGGNTREEKLAIMRDSRTGVYGALALIFSVALRVVALNQIVDPWQVLGALIAAHALARATSPVAMRFLEPARSDGLGASAGRPEQNIVMIAGAIGVLIALFSAGIRPGLGAIIATALAACAVGWVTWRQIGGYTGDTLGAIEQAGEIAALLAIASWSP